MGRLSLATDITLIDVEKWELTMSFNGQQVVFNILNACKYLEEGVIDCSLISSWDSLNHKQLIQDNDELWKELGELDKEELKKDNILSGPPQSILG